MPRPFLAVPLLVAVAAAVWLTRSALLRWRDLRAAQTYELAVELRPLLLRAGGAVLCFMCVTALTVAVTVGGSVGGRQVRAVVAVPSEPSPTPTVSPSASAVPPPPGPARFESIGHPAGGELFQGAVPDSNGRPRTVRVWLPAQYQADANARFPVVVLHAGTARKTADAELPDVFEGFASAVKLGKARPFVVVAPEGPNGTEHPCELVAAAPQAVADDASLRAAVGAAFRTRSAGPDGWAALGIDSGAPCAVAAGLARPDLYGAAVAISGRYDPAALTQQPGVAPDAHLLLAVAKDDAPGLVSARKLQAALHAAHPNVRLSDTVTDYTPERERLRLVRVAMQYLAGALPA